MLSFASFWDRLWNSGIPQGASGGIPGFLAGSPRRGPLEKIVGSRWAPPAGSPWFSLVDPAGPPGKNRVIPQGAPHLPGGQSPGGGGGRLNKIKLLVLEGPLIIHFVWFLEDA